MRRLAIGVIKFYQFAISPLMGKSCRFYPTCSCYAEESFNRYGFFKGGYLTMLRLVKCHPFHPGGYDPVVGQTERETKTPCHTNHTEL
mgnify:CR=1 FL=1